MTDFDPVADSGIVIVNKSQGWTNRNVVDKLRRIFRTKKIDRSGTLDPMATSMLVLGIDRDIRFLPHVHADAKSYRAAIHLGAATLTNDTEGELFSESSATSVTDEMIREKITDFTDIIMQKPAAVPTMKIDGIRAYEHIRRGEEVDILTRPVTITRYKVLGIRHDSGTSRPGECIDIDTKVNCSAGTFIHVLARGLGGALGVDGYLTTLRRTATGVFTIDEALTIDELTAKAEQFDTASPEIAEVRRPIPDHTASLLPVSLGEAHLCCSDTRGATEQQTADLAQGKWLESIGEPGAYAVVSSTGRVPALLTGSGKRAKAVFVMRPAAL